MPRSRRRSRPRATASRRSSVPPPARLIALLSIGALGVAACGGSEDGAPDVEVSAPATTAPADTASTDTASTDTASTDTASTDTASTDTDTGSDADTGSTDTASTGTDTGSDADTGSTTTTLVPSPDADLPTQRPEDAVEPAPVTTVAGPLPVPSVRFLEVGSFDQPVEATSVELDTRMVVVEQTGRVVAFDDESSTTLLDATSVPPGLSVGGEQGLLGVAFHPSLDLAYVDFTDGAGDTVIAEFAVDPLTLEFDPATYREVLRVDQPYGNHNGGEIAFGPDDLLYIGFGDGGSADDPERRALDLATPLGKLLRIDPVPADGGGDGFTVPDDNPFLDVEGADPAIWSIGLRNPWKFSFDSLTGDLWIADVGQGDHEEVDLAPATDGVDAGRGLDFGWSAFEGFETFNADQSAPGHWPPVFTYPHDDGNCSISGGVVARSSSYGDLNGWYVFGDYCTGTVWALDTTSVAATVDGPSGEPVVVELGQVPSPTAFVEGPDGDIYALSLAGGLYRLAPT